MIAPYPWWVVAATMMAFSGFLWIFAAAILCNKRWNMCLPRRVTWSAGLIGVTALLSCIWVLTDGRTSWRAVVCWMPYTLCSAIILHYIVDQVRKSAGDIK